MAINISPQMFSGGAVVLPKQDVNLYAQLLAKKQAKNEAIDEYYRKLPSTLNSAGMRDQDRAGFDQKVAEWQAHWMKNKDAIRKGNTKEAFDNEQLFRQIQTGLNDSKNAARTDLELGKMRFNKENGYIFDDPDFMEAQHRHTTPVWDKEHKSMDLGTVAIPIKPLDAEGKDKLWNIATKGIDTGKVYDYSKKYTNPQTGQVIVPFAKIHSDKQIIPIAENYAASIKNDKSAIKYYNDILHNADEETINKLQAAYSSKYPGTKVQGKNGTFIVPDQMDTPEKVAKAEAILRASVPKETGEEQESNWQQKNQASINKIYIQDSLIKGRQRSSLPADVAEYDILAKYENKAVSKTTTTVVPTVGGKSETITKTEKRIPAGEIPIQHRELIKTKPFIDEKGNKYYVLLDDGNWQGQGDSPGTGQVISWETVAQSEMDRVTGAEARRGRQNLTRDNTSPTPSKATGKVTKAGLPIIVQ